MVLSYRSSREAQILIAEIDDDGNTRIARATLDPMNNRWRAQLESPTGVRQCSNIYGNKGDVRRALDHYLNETQTEWLQEKSRGFRPPPQPKDHNRPVDEFGQAIGAAPVRNIPRVR